MKSSFDVECGVENLGLYITLLSILFIPANDFEYLDAFIPNCSNAPNPPKAGWSASLNCPKTSITQPSYNFWVLVRPR